MMRARFWTLIAPILVVSVLVLVGVACSETSPERVDDSADDSEEVVDEATDDADDAEAAEDAEVATEDAEEASDEASDDTDADVTETDPVDDQELEEAEGFAVGDTVRMGDLVMRLHGVRWDDGGEFLSPDEGMRWLIADIEIENEADSPTTISSLMMFDLVDQENRTRDMAFGADTEGSMDGELGAGRSMRGDIAWEVRAEQNEWELIFTPQLFGFGQAIFDITEADFQ
jgi:hypothetical protein